MDSFKRDIREQDLWCSSCMVAFDGKDPVGVLIGCKRPPYTNVLRLAVHPDHVRKGHGRHMLTSLSAKLAILGPPRLVAEVPADDAAACALFVACGWRTERTYRDFRLDASIAGDAPASAAIAEVTLDDIADAALPPVEAPRSWPRSRGTLVNRAERLRGLALASDERVEASLLYTRDDASGSAVWSLHAAPGVDPARALGLLIRELRRRAPGPVLIPAIADSEVAAGVLAHLGFSAGAETIGYVSEAGSRA